MSFLETLPRTPTRIILATIRLYRRFISPLFPPSCRYHPTCSVYAEEAVDSLGPIRGGWLAIKRLLRCNPFFSGGYDPPPGKRTGN